MLHRKLLAMLLGVATIMMLGLATAAPAQAAPDRGSLDPLPVTGTVTEGGTFEGTFTPEGFSVVNGVLHVTGQLTGTITDATGGVVGSVDELVTAPVELSSGASCEILSLDLGPLHLDLLGLVVDLSEVELDITAVPGPGNLLGNLLCAVAGLLDSPSGADALLDVVARLLNRVLGALG